MDTAVGLVKAYLELCGYFVLSELPVRAADKRGYHDVTDIDILAVRFPHEAGSLSGRRSRPLNVFLGLDPVLGTFLDGVDVLVGEVKEGQAHFNSALRRREVIAFALRRVGCCPEEMVDDEAERIARDGSREHVMSGGMRCRVRLVAFGRADETKAAGARRVDLAHCARYIQSRLIENREVLSGVQFKDSVLGLFALQDKLAMHRGGTTIDV